MEFAAALFWFGRPWVRRGSMRNSRPTSSGFVVPVQKCQGPQARSLQARQSFLNVKFAADKFGIGCSRGLLTFWQAMGSSREEVVCVKFRIRCSNTIESNRDLLKDPQARSTVVHAEFATSSAIPGACFGSAGHGPAGLEFAAARRVRRAAPLGCGKPLQLQISKYDYRIQNGT